MQLLIGLLDDPTNAVHEAHIAKATALRIESTQEPPSAKMKYLWVNPLSTCDCKIGRVDRTRSRIRKLPAVGPRWRCAVATDSWAPHFSSLND